MSCQQDQKLGSETSGLLRVVFVINGSLCGHSQMQFLSYARALATSCKISMLFIFPVDLRSPMVKEFASLGVEVSSLGCKRRVTIASIYRTFRYFKNQRPEIIHSQHPIAGVNAKVAGWFYKLQRRDVRIICEQRNEAQGLSLMARRLEYLTFPAADLVLCSSTRVEKSYFGSSMVLDPDDLDLKSRKHYTFFNSIDLDLAAVTRVDRRKSRSLLLREWGITEEDFVVVTVAKFSKQKDYPTLISAFAKALAMASGVKFKLICVGDGPDRSAIVDLVQSLNLESVVVTAGFRNDVQTVLCGADCFVLSSKWEGLPKVLLEAMSIPLPCVVTQVGGSEDVVRNEVDGLLVPPGESQACADALVRLATDPGLARAIAASAKVRVQSFSAREQAQTLLAVYRRLYSSVCGA